MSIPTTPVQGAIQGGCLCGAVRFEVSRFEGPFELCHCSRCRKASGSAFAAMIGVNREDFELLSGADLIRAYRAPVRKFAPGYGTAFCSICGSPVPRIEGSDTWFEIPAGLLDDADDSVPVPHPDRHIYVDYASTWYAIKDEVPQLTEAELIKLRLESRE